MIGDKKILDACCGSRMFWFNKENENTLYMDIRQERHVLCDGRVLNVKPDLIADFRNMPFDDNSFRLVVFDPPHFDKLGQNSWMAKKYGRLLPTWEDDISAGFQECMRVLEPYGVMIFKWNEHQIPIKKLLSVINEAPLFGHTSRKNGETIWMTFMKMPTNLSNP